MEIEKAPKNVKIICACIWLGIFFNAIIWNYDFITLYSDVYLINRKHQYEKILCKSKWLSFD